MMPGRLENGLVGKARRKMLPTTSEYEELCPGDAAHSLQCPENHSIVLHFRDFKLQSRASRKNQAYPMGQCMCHDECSGLGNSASWAPVDQ